MPELALQGGRPIFAPLLDWRSFWPPVDQDTESRLVSLYRSRRWTAFDDTEARFAQDFARFHGARYGIFTINGTVTLQCALAAYGIGPGDEVIVTALTWYATAMAVRHVGATPVFVDILPDTLCMDPAKMEAAVNARTKAVIPVHAYSAMADMGRIMAIAGKHRLRVIEDCAHMHGGILDGRSAGSIGDIGSFSFQNTKTMSSGEGGICITDDEAIADRLFRMKQIGYGHGEIPRHAKSGPPKGLVCYNFRATAFHPVILQEQLTRLEERLQRYQVTASYLEDRLRRTTRIRFQASQTGTQRQGRFGWVLRFDAPEYADVPIELIHKALVAEGVSFFRAEGPIYRFILFNLKEHEYRIDGSCDVTEGICARSLWLLHAFLGLEDDQIARVADAIEKVVSNIDHLRRYESEKA
jgi:L-glutamine:2-deoxy-scyllo-inosose/3-amino-2,3-dideoxy-scyllo-inosose aminotransferase